MEAEQSSNMNLPEDLVAKIIAMMPFPYIFKAQTLSKTWLARFSPVKSPFDEPQKSQRGTRAQARYSPVTAVQKKVGTAACHKKVGAAAFQKLVLEQSVNWPIFFSFPLGSSYAWAYEMASHSWRRLPSLKFLPDKSVRDWKQMTTAAGALVCFCSDIGWTFRPRKKFCIANVFTRSCKLLPHCPIFESHNLLRHTCIVTNPSMQTYKVILLFELIRSGYESRLEIYDSKSNTWSSKKMCLTGYSFAQRNVVHLNGVLYWTDGLTKLYALHWEEGTFTALPLSVPLDFRIPISNQHLVVCSSSLVMVLTGLIDSVETCKLMKIDPGSGRLGEIAIGSGPDMECSFRSHVNSHVNSRPPIGHGDCIYLSFTPSSGLTYNLPKDEWSCWDVGPNVPMSDFCLESIWNPFQTGLNVFMPV